MEHDKGRIFLLFEYERVMKEKGKQTNFRSATLRRPRNFQRKNIPIQQVEDLLKTEDLKNYAITAPDEYKSVLFLENEESVIKIQPNVCIEDPATKYLFMYSKDTTILLPKFNVYMEKTGPDKKTATTKPKHTRVSISELDEIIEDHIKSNHNLLTYKLPVTAIHNPVLEFEGEGYTMMKIAPLLLLNKTYAQGLI